MPPWRLVVSRIAWVETKDIPLQDKAEAVGGDRGVEQKKKPFLWNELQRNAETMGLIPFR